MKHHPLVESIWKRICSPRLYPQEDLDKDVRQFLEEAAKKLKSGSWDINRAHVVDEILGLSDEPECGGHPWSKPQPQTPKSGEWCEHIRWGKWPEKYQWEFVWSPSFQTKLTNLEKREGFGHGARVDWNFCPICAAPRPKNLHAELKACINKHYYADILELVSHIEEVVRRFK